MPLHQPFFLTFQLGRQGISRFSQPGSHKNKYLRASPTNLYFGLVLDELDDVQQK